MTAGGIEVAVTPGAWVGSFLGPTACRLPRGIDGASRPQAACRGAVSLPTGAAGYGIMVIVTTFEDSFERNPKIAGGQPVLRGTRVPLRTVLASLAEGASFEEILKNFPTLTAQHLRAAVAFAASSAQEDLPVPSAPPV
jgi:uncharacterized protein (DUF433 family)